MANPTLFPLCPHYPKRVNFNAMVVEDESRKSGKEVPNRVNLLQLQNALSARGTSNSKGLPYVCK